MDQVKVSELATEFEMKNSVVISELKKIGVWVPSADTPVDHDIADRIRRRLQMIIEIDQQEVEKAREKKQKKEKKEKKKKKVSTAKARKTIKELGKPRKGVPKKKEEEEAQTESAASPLAHSLKPRKGRASYRRIAAESVEPPQKVEVSIDDEPILEKVEAQLSAELLEKALQEPTPEELRRMARAPIRRTERKEPTPPPQEEEPAEAEEAAEAAVSETADEVAATEPVEVEAASEAVEAGEEEEIREVVFSEKVTVKELSEALRVKSNEVVKQLMQRGLMANINQILDEKVVEEICEAHGVIARVVPFEEAAVESGTAQESPEDLVPRAPVVTVMGHVDHGKTSLLDAFRKTNVAAGEAGGITQHIGAYHVDVGDRRIVFIDTPGHEAFTRMRARGAQATDLVVLVVAADDGVMPQTIEAINHARAAQVPIVVAINKIDRPEANPNRVKQALSEHNLIPEDWGGDTVMVEVSALEGTNLDLLLEMILITADLRELKANPSRPASGVILEARLEKGRGAVATVLVQNGTLHVGDTFIAGSAFGKVRAMFNDDGKSVRETGPSSSVEILGLQGMPQAGDLFQAVDDMARAREIVEYRQQQTRERALSKSARVSLEELYSQMEAGEVKELPVVIKADTQGSAEVLEETLVKLSTEKVRVQPIHTGVGAITESDVLLASTSSAIVVGFNVRPDKGARDTAADEGVEIRLYTVIYDVADEIKKAMRGLLEPVFREVPLGRLEVRDTFRVPKFGVIAGCYVSEGLVRRNAEARLLRDNVVIYEGKIDSLRRFKEDVNEVKSGYECGCSITNYNDVKVGDVIEIFVREEATPEL